MKKIPKELSSAFTDFCKMYDWSEQEVLAYLMLHAIRQGVDLAPKLHRQRIYFNEDTQWFSKQLQQLFFS